MSWSNRDGRRAQIDEAVRRGRCAASEGIMMHLNPYTDHGLREAWIVGWTSIMAAGSRARVVRA